MLFLFLSLSLLLDGHRSPNVLIWFDVSVTRSCLRRRLSPPLLARPVLGGPNHNFSSSLPLSLSFSVRRFLSHVLSHVRYFSAFDSSFFQQFFLVYTLLIAPTPMLIGDASIDLEDFTTFFLNSHSHCPCRCHAARFPMVFISTFFSSTLFCCSALYNCRPVWGTTIGYPESKQFWFIWIKSTSIIDFWLFDKRFHQFVGQNDSICSCMKKNIATQLVDLVVTDMWSYEGAIPVPYTRKKFRSPPTPWVTPLFSTMHGLTSLQDTLFRNGYFDCIVRLFFHFRELDFSKV